MFRTETNSDAANKKTGYSRTGELPKNAFAPFSRAPGSTQGPVYSRGPLRQDGPPQIKKPELKHKFGISKPGPAQSQPLDLAPFRAETPERPEPLDLGPYRVTEPEEAVAA